MDLLPVIFTCLFIGMLTSFAFSIKNVPMIVIMIAASIYLFSPVIDPSTPISMSVLSVVLYLLGFGAFKWLINWCDKNG